MQSVQNAQLPTFSRVTLFPVKSPIKVAQRTLLLSLSGLRAGSRGRMGRTISMRFPVCSPLDKLPSMCPFLYVLHLSHKDSSVHSNSTLAFSLFNAPNLINESDPPNSLFLPGHKAQATRETTAWLSSVRCLTLIQTAVGQSEGIKSIAFPLSLGWHCTE